MKQEYILITVVSLILAIAAIYYFNNPAKTATPSGLSQLLSSIGNWFGNIHIGGPTPAQAAAAIPGTYNSNTNADTTTLPPLPDSSTSGLLPPLPTN